MKGIPMEAIINNILSQMQTLLSGRQLKSLENVLQYLGQPRTRHCTKR